jgi:predicted enzyme related to lactoylglutathione lyase
MFKDTYAFSGFSVNDLDEAKKFYTETLGVNVEEDAMGLTLKLSGGANVFVYPKATHTPATFTILNFVVTNIDQTVQELQAKGVSFEHYDMNDEKEIARGITAGQGPDIAWFKDPAGNILSVLQEA